MKTKYKYIEFNILEKKEKTDVWQCINIKYGTILGIIKWYYPWRQYIYYSMSSDIFYSKSCHDDISDFLDQVNKNKKGN